MHEMHDHVDIITLVGMIILNVLSFPPNFERVSYHYEKSYCIDI